MKFIPPRSGREWRWRRLLCRILGHPEFEPLETGMWVKGQWQGQQDPDWLRCTRCAQLQPKAWMQGLGEQ